MIGPVFGFYIKLQPCVFFKLNRMIDLFKDRIVEGIDDVPALLKEHFTMPPFYRIVETRADAVIFHLFGTLDSEQMQRLDIDTYKNDIGVNNCIFNLKNISFVDSSGLMLFLKIQKYVAEQEKTCLLCGMKKNVLQMFRMTKLDKLFTMAKDLPSTEKQIAGETGK